MTASLLPVPEFSHPLSIDKIPAAGMDITLSARDQECRDLAERFGLVDIASLNAVVTVHPVRSDQAVKVTGKLTSDVVQTCVVTLEPLPSKIEKEFETLFVAPDLVDNDDENSEPLIQKTIDLGELVAQHLATALDPYPRKPGLAFVEAEYGETFQRENPFARLVAKKDEPNKD